MPKPDTINDPQHWRDRAAEMRALADCMEKPETVAIMAKRRLHFVSICADDCGLFARPRPFLSAARRFAGENRRQRLDAARRAGPPRN
jgi:hypothetical protein